MGRSAKRRLPHACTHPCCALVAALAFAAGPVHAEGTLPDSLVYLRDIDPTILQDIRYASSNNFVGRPLDGYEAPECILRRDVAMALAQVQKDLAASGLGLKVYDCYRPTRAVRTMANWANDGRAGGATKRFYPKLQKNTLFASGYIASRSAHSTGTAVDLTVVEMPPAEVAKFDPAATYGACTGPVEQAQPRQLARHGNGLRLLRSDQLDLRAAGSAPSSTAGAWSSSRRCGVAASPTTSANGGISPSGRPTAITTCRYGRGDNCAAGANRNTETRRAAGRPFMSAADHRSLGPARERRGRRPAGPRTSIEYLAHGASVPVLQKFFAGSKREDLPDGEGWAIERIALTTHNGTHLDAPWHYASTMDRGKPAATIDNSAGLVLPAGRQA